MASKKKEYQLGYNSDRESFSSTSSLDTLNAKMKTEGLGTMGPIVAGQNSSKYQSSALVYLAVLCAHMSSVSMGCTFGWSAPALESMENWKESPYRPESGTSQGNWIASILTLGALVGAMFCGNYLI